MPVNLCCAFDSDNPDMVVYPFLEEVVEWSYIFFTQIQANVYNSTADLNMTSTQEKQRKIRENENKNKIIKTKKQRKTV